MAGTLWPSLTAGQKARAADVEAKFDWIEGHIVPMQGGNLTTGVYDLGTTTAHWRNLHLSGSIINSGATALAIQPDSSIKLRIGPAVNEFSTDGTLGDNSDNAVPTEQAVKTYVDAASRTFSQVITTVTMGAAGVGESNTASARTLIGATSTAQYLYPLQFNSVLHDTDSNFTTTGIDVSPSAGTFTSHNTICYKVPSAGWYEHRICLNLVFHTTTLSTPYSRVQIQFGIESTNLTGGSGWFMNTTGAYLSLTPSITSYEFTAVLQVPTTTVSDGSVTNAFFIGIVTGTGSSSMSRRQWSVNPTNSSWYVERLR